MSPVSRQGLGVTLACTWANGPHRAVTREPHRIAPDMEWEPVLGADALLSCHRTETAC